MLGAADAEATRRDDPPPAVDLDVAPARGGRLKWIGIAAGALIVAGIVSYLALSILGRGATGAATEPAVIARPKASPAAMPAPIAGIEAEETRISASMAAAVAARDAAAAAATPSVGELGTAGGDPLETDDRVAPEMAGPEMAGRETAGRGTAELEPGAQAASTDAAPPSRATRAGSPADDAPGSETTVDSSTPATDESPAAPAPVWENPADAEVDAPYW
jgi:hypothetical protein